jgi:pyruvate/2-oxoglutarate/acetoin dehydrogenase E1 component
MEPVNGLIFKIGETMKYKEELIRSMEWLGQKEEVLFLGQACKVSGHSISSTIANTPQEKRIELPVFEETQLGISTGLALEGFIPITIYPRFDFFILACNQLVNHLDKMQDMSKGDMNPKVIIRVSVGAKKPLDAGPQHTQNHTEAFAKMLTNIDVVELLEPEQIFPAFKKAYERTDGRPTLMVEHGEFYVTK